MTQLAALVCRLLKCSVGGMVFMIRRLCGGVQPERKIGTFTAETQGFNIERIFRKYLGGCPFSGQSVNQWSSHRRRQSSQEPKSCRRLALLVPNIHYDPIPQIQCRNVLQAHASGELLWRV